MELVRQRRRRLDRAEAGTVAFGAAALGAAVTAIVSEARRLRRPRPEHHTPRELLADAQERVHHAVEETRAGYQALSPTDTARFNLLTSFVTSATLARLIALRLRSRRALGPFRNLVISDRHIHHFVPGLGLVFMSGAGALLTGDQHRRAKLAVPFGVGLGLALDESALLLHLDDVYWRREGLVGFQITLTAMAAMAAVPLVRRLRAGALAAG